MSPSHSYVRSCSGSVITAPFGRRRESRRVGSTRAGVSDIASHPHRQLGCRLSARLRLSSRSRYRRTSVMPMRRMKMQVAKIVSTDVSQSSTRAHARLRSRPKNHSPRTRTARASPAEAQRRAQTRSRALRVRVQDPRRVPPHRSVGRAWQAAGHRVENVQAVVAADRASASGAGGQAVGSAVARGLCVWTPAATRRRLTARRLT